jgi:hypothetical protein
MGVPLKIFPPVEYEETDWDELSEYAAELERGQPPEGGSSDGH